MQTLSVTEKGIEYLGYCLSYYSQGCVFFVLYIAALVFVLLKGSNISKKVFVPSFLLMLFTILNPLFPVVLNRFFDVNNEYYRFFWIVPAVILVSYIMTVIVNGIKGYFKYLVLLFFVLLIVFGGNFLYKDGFIKAPNIYKMPTEIPEISKMIHEDCEDRYKGEYYPRAAFEYDYEMCMRQYDAGIMLFCDREAYLNAVSGKLTMKEILSEENYYNRILAVVALGIQIDPDEFRQGLDNTGTEYVCVSSANEDLCEYLENKCDLRLVGNTANHSLYGYELSGENYFVLPDYSDVWENY